MRGVMNRLLCTGLLMAAVACSGGHRNSENGEGSSRVSIKGSDTMIVLAQRWAEAYMREHEGRAIEVSGGGSGTGVAALLNGTVDIANASRPLKQEEREHIAEGGAEAVETPVALDALAVYVHQDNPIESFTIEQLANVFKGNISNWSELGGPDQTIVLYSRENSSGTYAYFKESVLAGGDFAAQAQTLPGTAAVINAISRDEGGIGYGGIGYATGIRTVPIVSDGAPVEPTLENTVSGAYPLSRHLSMVTRGEPEGAIGDFIAWVRTPAGQELVSEAGFYPLPSLTDAHPAADEPHAQTAGEEAAGEDSDGEDSDAAESAEESGEEGSTESESEAEPTNEAADSEEPSEAAE